MHHLGWPARNVAQFFSENITTAFTCAGLYILFIFQVNSATMASAGKNYAPDDIGRFNRTPDDSRRRLSLSNIPHGAIQNGNPGLILITGRSNVYGRPGFHWDTELIDALLSIGRFGAAWRLVSSVSANTMLVLMDVTARFGYT